MDANLEKKHPPFATLHSGGIERSGEFWLRYIDHKGRRHRIQFPRAVASATIANLILLPQAFGQAPDPSGPSGQPMPAKHVKAVMTETGELGLTVIIRTGLEMVFLLPREAIAELSSETAALVAVQRPPSQRN